MQDCSLLCYGLIVLIGYVAIKLIKHILMQRKLDKWKHTPKDIVILHGTPRTAYIPAGSPFVLKLETFLRMANIPYKVDTKSGFGPKGKVPWITLNGEHYTDSQLIIDLLNKKFDLNLNKSYSEEKIAIGTAVRVMMEEHMFWGLARALFVDESRHEATMELKLPFPKWLILILFKRTYEGYLWAQGLGRTTASQTQELVKRDIKAFTTLLGSNKFMLGDEPSEVDAAVFGFAAQLIWGLGKNVKEYSWVKRDHTNLEKYCIRMRENFWPDWNQCLNPKK